MHLIFEYLTYQHISSVVLLALSLILLKFRGRHIQNSLKDVSKIQHDFGNALINKFHDSVKTRYEYFKYYHGPVLN